MPAHRPSSFRQPHDLLIAGLLWAAAASVPLAAAAAAPATAPAVAQTAEIQRLIKEGQHAQALKLIDESLARNPADAQMRFRRGVALSMLDRKAEALAVFQKLVEDHPDMPAPYNNMAVIYGAQGDYEKARQALEKAIRTNPAYATAYQNLGDVYAQLASQAYTKALQLDKADTSVQPKLALLRELSTGSATTPSSPAAARPATKPATPAMAAMPDSSPAAASVPGKPAAAARPASAPVPLAAASRPAPAASAAPTSALAPAAASAPAAEVEAAVRAWAAAWSRRDMAAYYAAYTPEFSGQAASRKAWEQDRRDRIASRKQIKVEIGDLTIHVDGDRATAKFRQVYSSDALTAKSRKTLQLVRVNGRWLIRQEAVVG
jgi:tetratricopeptide (TPR) repeat protein